MHVNSYIVFFTVFIVLYFLALLIQLHYTPTRNMALTIFVIINGFECPYGDSLADIMSALHLHSLGSTPACLFCGPCHPTTIKKKKKRP